MTLAALQNLLDEKEQLQNKLRQQRQQKQELYGEAKLLQERLSQYDKQEATFNRQYEQTLARNLLGAYEAGTLELMLQVEQQQQHQLELQITAVARKKEELRQQQHQLSRQREDLQVKSGRLTAELVAAETDFKQLKLFCTGISTAVERFAGNVAWFVEPAGSRATAISSVGKRRIIAASCRFGRCITWRWN